MVSGEEGSDGEGTAFVEALSAITQGNVDLLVDVLPVAQRIVSYPLEQTIVKDAEAAELVRHENFAAICATLTSDATSGALPTGTEDDFPGEWKKYMKALGKALGLKGKDLFHPVRLALTGEMSGPDVGAQLQMVGMAERGAVVGPVVPMQARFEHLSNMISIDA
jgi:glutamyl-tRNA synthetase